MRYLFYIPGNEYSQRSYIVTIMFVWGIVILQSLLLSLYSIWKRYGFQCVIHSSYYNSYFLIFFKKWTSLNGVQDALYMYLKWYYNNYETAKYGLHMPLKQYFSVQGTIPIHFFHKQGRFYVKFNMYANRPQCVLDLTHYIQISYVAMCLEFAFKTSYSACSASMQK